MTSWAIVCDVWYLPPMYRKPEESAVDFANRVKAEIAHKGGMVDLDWDGGLKRSPAKKEWKEKQQLELATKIISNNNSFSRKSSSCTLISSSEFSEDEHGNLITSPIPPCPPLESGCEERILEHPEDALLQELEEEEDEDEFIMMNDPTPKSVEVKKEE